MADSHITTLLDRARRGDQEAMGRLLEAYRDHLFNTCLRMLRHHEDAADVCQDAMVRIIEHLPRFRGDSDLSTWMIRIAMNQCLSHLRRQRVPGRRAASLDGAHAGRERAGDEGSPWSASLPDGREPSPSARVEQQERRALLERALAALDEDFRAVLILRDLQEMDYRQIARVLEVKEGTVKSRLFRARLALRQELMRYEQADRSAGAARPPSRAARPEVSDG